MVNAPILIVDDEKNVRLTLTQVLGSAGYDAEAVSSGAEALGRVQAATYLLVLLDLRMPGVGGMDVLHQLREHYPNIPVVVITAHGNTDTAVEAMQAGAAHFIEKPFTPDELRNVVDAVLRKPRSSDVEAEYEQHMADARAAVHERNLERATQLAHDAIAIDATRPEAFNVLGVVMQLEGRLEAARRAFRAALGLDPTYHPASDNLDNIGQSFQSRDTSSYSLG